MVFDITICENITPDGKIDNHINTFTLQADSHAQAFDIACEYRNISDSHNGMIAVVKLTGYMMPVVIIPIRFIG